MLGWVGGQGLHLRNCCPQSCGFRGASFSSWILSGGTPNRQCATDQHLHFHFIHTSPPRALSTCQNIREPFNLFRPMGTGVACCMHRCMRYFLQGYTREHLHACTSYNAEYQHNDGCFLHHACNLIHKHTWIAQFTFGLHAACMLPSAAPAA